MKTTEKDRLVSTAVLEQRLAELETEIQADRRKRAVGDPVFVTTAWLIAEFREAIRIATLEYRPTKEVAVLTGWSAPTLRDKGRARLAGEDPGEGWRDLLVKFDAGDYSFAIATVPVKKTGELKLQRSA